MPHRLPFPLHFLLSTSFLCWPFTSYKSLPSNMHLFPLPVFHISKKSRPTSVVSIHSTFWVMGQVSVTLWVWSDGSQPKRQLLIRNWLEHLMGFHWDYSNGMCVSFSSVVSTTRLCQLTLQGRPATIIVRIKMLLNECPVCHSGFARLRRGSAVMDIWYRKPCLLIVLARSIW